MTKATSPYLNRPLRSLIEVLDRMTDPRNARNKTMTPTQYARFRAQREERERVTGNIEPRKKEPRS